jgi:phage tail-like protein
MRGVIAGLDSPHPFDRLLPGIYQDAVLAQKTGRFLQRLLGAFDVSLAPVFASLDNIDAYLDPSLAPDDFVEWLAGWVGIELDERWPLEYRRALIAKAVSLYRRRGTAAGLAEHIELVTAGRAEVAESGGVAWSTSPGAPPPGTAEARVAIRVHMADPSPAQAARVDALVAAAKPAHVAAKVEVVQG